MALPLAQTLVSSAASAVASKAMEGAVGQPSHTKSYISLGAGLATLLLYHISKGNKLKYVDVPRKWALYGGLGLLAYGVYCLMKKGSY